ncbi:sigma-54 dependent transcriptional regulator [Pelagicoccus sp. SDUM812003]|uniref:sigma-54-dependent transcriptional regulator n=1 Tax=Pelagicoccus sp. SDUM812003 TaxID=3041267 RepID=UPI00280EE930|nr:sigma-54 dependent transcriptional regulator [Pelagicoccus sp. SDUM812003]MDQ8201545.1 sigma-54 dependent transcriptional regulator [Pelagicoccus sp. SDUM812003]
MTLERILILDDELVIRKALEEQLRRKRFSVCSVGTLKEADEHLSKDEFDLLFVDVHLPDGNGTELLERVAGMQNPPLVVIMTGYGTVESAVKCMQSGAFDYIIKPFSSSQIDVLVKKAQDYRQLVKVNQFLASENSEGAELIGKSNFINQLRDVIRKVAPTEATVLICGENGTGKELVANELYRCSARRNAPFIRVNCAAISESLIESEFFGHEKGAYTGATQRREGRFELADGGTILLDEISEISPKVQAKLLRVLQEREFERVGGNKTIKVDVRVIATTNRNLAQSVERGLFRQDLYYRLNVFPIQVPPLRDRHGDVALLAKNFAQKFARKHGKKIKGFEESALASLDQHPWPGNVRELQNTIERAVILTESAQMISSASLGLFAMPTNVSAPLTAPVYGQPMEHPMPAYAGGGYAPGSMAGHAHAPGGGFYDHPQGGFAPHSPPSRGMPDAPPKREEPAPSQSNVDEERGRQVEEAPLPLEEIEKRHILSTLETTEGNRTKAAKILGISIRTLRNKISAYRKDGEYIPGGDD